jgi:hypothetical protein
MLFSDLALARKLERAEGKANTRHVEARARQFPQIGACWMEVAGAYAMFDGVGSPCTQTFGLGLFETVTGAHLDQLESFFTSRGAEVFHETSPMGDPQLLPLLGGRGYRPVEYTSVLYLPLESRTGRLPATPNLRVRISGKGEEDLWARVAAEGWVEQVEFAGLIRDLLRVSTETEGGFRFIAELDGRPIASGSMAIHDGVAVLAGASTIPAERKQGAQNALLEARLQYAAEQGCTLAMIGAAPGSASQRNAQRNGFHIAYTRVKWGLVRS